MKEMKRILSLFLCLAMLVGYMPVGVLAAEDESATEPSAAADVVVETTVPETTVPETTVPETTVPETTVPETTVPETTVPETTVPETTVPETTVPETTVPETTVPETTVPETTAPTEPAKKTPARKPSKKPANKVGSQVTGQAAPQDATKDYLFFAAGSAGVASMIDNMEAKIGENQLDYLCLSGISSGNSSDILAEINGAATGLSAANVDIVAVGSVEDGAEIVLSSEADGAQIYEGDRFYVYGVTEDADPQAFVEWANGSEIDKTKAVMVLSYAPVHDGGDAAWIEALNTVAAGKDTVVDRNVVYFWSSEEVAETDEEKALSYVAPNGSIPGAEGAAVTVYFTYVKAGNLQAENAATLVTITENTVTIEKYVGNAVSVSEDQDRVAPSAEPETPAKSAAKEPSKGTATATGIRVVNNKETYYVGDELDITVYQTYSNGTEKAVEDYTVSGFNSAKPGMCVVTVKYGKNQTAILTVKVKEPEAAPTVNRIRVVKNKEVYYVGEELDITVYAVYTDGSEKEITPDKIEGFDNTKVGTQSVFVTYGKFSTTVAVHVQEKPYVPTVVELKVLHSKESLLGQNPVLIVAAVYDDGSIQVLTEEEYQLETGYGQMGSGAQTYIVTYGDVSHAFTMGTDAQTQVSVLADGMDSLVVEDVTADQTVAAAAGTKFDGAFYAYDITPNKYNTKTSSAVVSMPAPEGANAVYYWNEGTNELELVKDTAFGDGKVVFTTDHFSVYLVGQNTRIELEEGFGDRPVNSSKPVTIPITVYTQLSGAPKPGKSYLISNAVNTYFGGGSVYLLAVDNKQVTGSAITPLSGDIDGNGTNETYFIPKNADNVLWTVGGDSTDVYTLRNNGLYLNDDNGLVLNNSASTQWRRGTNTLYYYKNSGTYYLRYSNGWGTSTSTGMWSNTNAYFLEPVQYNKSAYELIRGTYSIDGQDIIQVVDSNSVTVKLNANLIFDDTWNSKVDSWDIYDKDNVNQDSVKFEVYQNGGDPDGIIQKIEKGTDGFWYVTLAAKESNALIKVSCDVPVGKKEKDETTYAQVFNYIQVTTKKPYIAVEITNEDNGNVVMKDSYTIKGVTQETTLDLGAKVTQKAYDSETPLVPKLTWSIVSGGEYASVDQNGLVKFNGVNGEVKIKVVHTETDESGKIQEYADGLVIVARKSVASADSSDYPVWGQPGSVRYDKTATAIGDFSRTGVAQIELSMAGIPFGSPVDVYLMVDMSSSVTNNGLQNTLEAATRAFAREITDNGTNQNRIAVGYFSAPNGSNDYRNQRRAVWNDTLITFSDYEESRSKTDFNFTADVEDKIENYMLNRDGNTYVNFGNGTNYDEGLEEVHRELAALKDRNDNSTENKGRPLFVVFISDGAPGYFRYINGDEGGKAWDYHEVGGSTYPTEEHIQDILEKGWKEYWTDKMEQELDAVIYTVGLNLSSQVDHNALSILQDMASDRSKYANVEPSDNPQEIADNLQALMKAFAGEIKSAASDIKVEDMISKTYNITFNWPSAVDMEDRVLFGDVNGDNVDDGLYLEVVNYGLDEKKERDGTYDVLQRIYVKADKGVITGISFIGTGNQDNVTVVANSLPTFAAKKDYEQAYYNYDATTREWSYDANGQGTHHMVSGAAVKNGNIYTPYFVYDAKKTIFTWTVTSLSDESEMALRYFVYLTNSMETVNNALTEGTKPVQAGPYYTNEYAKVNYTNHLGHECEQTFPMPVLTWNGAQVSYVFYLVDKEGQPVNRSGERVTSFNEAVYITDVQTQSVIWNEADDSAEELTGTAELNVPLLAKGLLPDYYRLYDENAAYTIYVHRYAGTQQNGVDYSDIYNYFVIRGSQEGALKTRNGAQTANISTTKVFNTKSDITKYTITSAENIVNENLLYSACATERKTYKDGKVIPIKRTDNGVEYIYSEITEVPADHFNYGATTVAFAVTWTESLNPDTVVVDYGLPVDIDVVANDVFYNKVNGISVNKPPYDEDQNSDNYEVKPYKPIETTVIGGESHTFTAELMGSNIVRFTPKGMIFNEAVKFYYEASVQEGGPYVYSSVTVIPATTIYYEDGCFEEDGFVKLEAFELDGYVKATNVTADAMKNTAHYVNVGTTENPKYELATKYEEDKEYWVQNYVPIEPNDLYGWVDVGTKRDDPFLQAQDRPGAALKAEYDKDNIYGYDSAYSNFSEYSLGSAKKIDVSKDVYGTATFTFCGTGFDVIGLTSNATGSLLMEVRGDNNLYKTKIVDTFYGYEYCLCNVTYKLEEGKWVRYVVEKNTEATEQQLVDTSKAGDKTELKAVEFDWIVSANSPTTLYQVPVMEMAGLPYGTYTVTIRAFYNELFDHQKSGDYELYLDAIRIYDPADDGTVVDEEGNVDKTILNAYLADHEAYPVYQELRNNVISSSDFKTGKINGVVFMDSKDATFELGEYISYGPKNELYLKPGQAIAFSLNLEDFNKYDVSLHEVTYKLEQGKWVRYVGNKHTTDNKEVPVDTSTAGKETELHGVEYVETVSTIVDRVHLGMKTATGSPVNYAIIDASAVNEAMEQAKLEATANANQDAAKVFADAMTAVKTTELKTTTDMYYDITDLKDKVIIIYNKSGGILSLTNIKTTFTADPGSVGKLFYTDYDTIQSILDVERVIEPDVSTGTESNPCITEVTLPTKICSGAEVEVNIKTGNVTYTGDGIDTELVVNGVVTVELLNADGSVDEENSVEAEAALDENGNLIWQANVTAPTITDYENTQRIVVKVYPKTADGIMDSASDSVEASFLVYNFSPKLTFNDSKDPISAKVGTHVTLTVKTTDNEVAAVQIGTTLLTTYQKKENERIWSTEVVCDAAAAEEGTVTYPVVAYSKEGYEFKAGDINVIVQAATPTITQTVRNAVTSIANSLRSWLKSFF